MFILNAKFLGAKVTLPDKITPLSPTVLMGEAGARTYIIIFLIFNCNSCLNIHL